MTVCGHKDASGAEGVGSPGSCIKCPDEGGVGNTVAPTCRTELEAALANIRCKSVEFHG